MKKRVVGAVLVVGMALLIWHCEQIGGPAGPLALYDRPWNGNDALISGTLVRDGPCMYIGSEEGSRVFLGFLDKGRWWFPHVGTWWKADPPAVYMDGTTYEVGDEVAFGGSTVSDWKLWDWKVPPDPSCDLSVVWLVNPH